MFINNTIILFEVQKMQKVKSKNRKGKKWKNNAFIKICSV